MADGLLEQAGAVRRRYEELAHTLDEAGTSAAAVDLVEHPAVNGDEPAAADAETSVRVMALEMAVSGEPREATKEYLRESFGVEDSGPIVDEVYDREAAAAPAPPRKRRFGRRKG